MALAPCSKRGTEGDLEDSRDAQSQGGHGIYTRGYSVKESLLKQPQSDIKDFPISWALHKRQAVLPKLFCIGIIG
jgi:hypothetical protein